MAAVMHALCVVYNPSNLHLALGPVWTLVADSACCAYIYIYIYKYIYINIYIYMHEHWTVLNTDRNTNTVILLFQACAGSCYAKIWRMKTILQPPFRRRHFHMHFCNANVLISVAILLKFVPKHPIKSIQALDHIMAWVRPGDKPLSEPLVA